MNITRMKFIDELFGPPLCLIFHIYNLLIGPFTRRSHKGDKVKHILVIKFFGMGSILLAGPMMRVLKNTFLNSEIILLTFSSNKELASRIKLIDKVICVETDSFFRFTKSLLGAILQIRRLRCEVSIDLEFFAKSSTLIQYLCGSPIRVGYYLIQIGVFIKMMWRGNLLTHQVYYNPHKHTREAFLALAGAIGAQTNDRSPAEIDCLSKETVFIDCLLQKENIKPSDFLIVININSSPLCPERRWPLKNFIYLISNLQNHDKVKMILSGGSPDKDYVKELLNSLVSNKNIIDLAGELDIGSFIALLKKARLMISNDSGPMHLAASLNVPVAGFFGPETPIRFSPFGAKNVIFYPDIYCSPCLNVYNQKTAPCNGKNKCMEMILPEKVYSEIKERYLNEL